MPRLIFGNCDHCGTKHVPVVFIEGILPMNACKRCDVNGNYVKLTTYKKK